MLRFDPKEGLRRMVALPAKPITYQPKSPGKIINPRTLYKDHEQYPYAYGSPHTLRPKRVVPVMAQTFEEGEPIVGSAYTTHPQFRRQRNMGAVARESLALPTQDAFDSPYNLRKLLGL